MSRFGAVQPTVNVYDDDQLREVFTALYWKDILKQAYNPSQAAKKRFQFPPPWINLSVWKNYFCPYLRDEQDAYQNRLRKLAYQDERDYVRSGFNRLGSQTSGSNGSNGSNSSNGFNRSCQSCRVVDTVVDTHSSQQFGWQVSKDARNLR